jgi:hypothetical protein
MIFGGMIDYEIEEGDEHEKFTMNDSDRLLQLCKQSYYLDVTKGSIKRGPDLNTPCYFVNNGGPLLCMQNKLYAQGFGINQDMLSKQQVPLVSMNRTKEKSAVPIVKSARDATTSFHHKKILHCYDLAEQSFSEIHEGIFAAAQPASDPNDD